MKLADTIKLGLSSFSREALSIAANRTVAVPLRLFGLSKNKYEGLYKLMKKDLSEANEIYSPSTLWTVLEMQFSDILTINGLEKFKDEYINRHFAAYALGNKRVYEALIWQYYQSIEAKDNLGLLKQLEEPTVGGKGNVVLVKGKRFTLDLLQSIDEFYNILENSSIDTDEKSIFLELGAGYGRLAYIFIKALPKCTYVILDLPSSLLISQYYLPKVLQKLDYSGYETTRGLTSISREGLAKKRLWFFAALKLPFFEDNSIDTFINIYSLQEMKKRQIKQFLDLASRKTAKRIYLKEHFLEHNPINSEEITADNYVLGKGWKLSYDKISSLYLHSFERAFDKPK
ncbi:MAG: putative sugar O-methyltransferase [archaeon]|nr:putative sugar O-methyltransferase [archaeon]